MNTWMERETPINGAFGALFVAALLVAIALMAFWGNPQAWRQAIPPRQSADVPPGLTYGYAAVPWKENTIYLQVLQNPTTGETAVMPLAVHPNN